MDVAELTGTSAETKATYEKIKKYIAENIDITEALSAKEYFTYYHEGLNRRGDDSVVLPVESMEGITE